MFAYFARIGLAFLFVEVVFLQKLLRFVHHPTVALALVLATFLLAAGAGACGRHERGAGRLRARTAHARSRRDRPAWRVATRSASIRCSRDSTTGRLRRRSRSPPRLIAPLAFLMGMPFPLALRGLEAPLVPWAWGINGCASVVSPVLATLLAVDLGFTAVLWLALAGYAIIPLIFPEAPAQGHDRWLSMRNP